METLLRSNMNINIIGRPQLHLPLAIQKEINHFKMYNAKTIHETIAIHIYMLKHMHIHR